MTNKSRNRNVAAGYGSAGDAQDWQKRSKAMLFTYDPDMERLLEMRDTNPAKFDRVPLGKRTALGYYMSSKAAAEGVGMDTNPPKDAA